MGRRKLITKLVHVDPDKLAALKHISERRRVPVAAIIREGLDALLAAGAQVNPGPPTRRLVLMVEPELYSALEARALSEERSVAEVASFILEQHFSLAQKTK